MRAAEFNEGIGTIPSSEFRGGKRSLYIDTEANGAATKLPGGSRFVYTITPSPSNYGKGIYIWDPKGPDYINATTSPLPVKKPGEQDWQYNRRLNKWNSTKKQATNTPGQLIGKLLVSRLGWFPLRGAVQVEVITVDEDYRGQGIAKALYGIVLTIMKLPLVAGDSQTPGGRINWVSLASIPGVEVKGYVGLEKYELAPNMPSQAKRTEINIDTIMGQLGGDYIGQSPTGHLMFFAFDVQPNTTGKELEAYVKTNMSKIYGDTKFRAGLYATWSGA